MSVELLSRVQFAVTVMFHMTFPAVTVGLSVLLSITWAMWWRTGKSVYLQMFRFWRRIFGVGFAIGVVAGIVITFEMGLNWGKYAAKTGPVIGPIIGMEVVTAFVVEAAFLGVLLYGDGKVKNRTMFGATVMVAIGTILSSTWIIMANSWMQLPAGYEIKHGQFVPTDWWQILFSPSFGWRWPHMLIAVFVSAGMFVAGISAYYLIQGRAVEFGKRSLSLSLGIVAVLIPLQVAVGDSVAGEYVVAEQTNTQGLPVKMMAWEGNWNSDNNGYVVFAIPDQAGQRNLVEINVPWWGSAIGAKDLTGQTTTPGLNLVPKNQQPYMAWVFWGFRLMFYGSMVLFASAFIGTILRFRRRLYVSAHFHRWLLWTTPIGIAAILGGWLTAEVGRQPWVVWGQLNTADAAANLSMPQVVFSLIGFVGIYAALLGFYIRYITRTVLRGPERDLPDEAQLRQSPDPEGPAAADAPSMPQPVRPTVENLNSEVNL
jgi:cytochrome d ubiquinol oxidase subunit I